MNQDPPDVYDVLRTYIADYEFLCYLVYLYKYGQQELHVYLVFNEIFSEDEKSLYVSRLQECCISSSQLKGSFFDYQDIYKTIKGILTFSSQAQLLADILAIVDNESKQLKDGEGYYYDKYPSYLLISANDYSKDLDRKCMIPQAEGAIVDLNYQRAFYKLFNSYSELGVATYRNDTKNINEKFSHERIIFLDIDGVLNNDGYNDSGEHEYFNVGMIKELSYLIQKTNAKVILSSSWRGCIAGYIGGYNNDPKLKEFLDALYRENVLIYGMTPGDSMNGGSTRPTEIRAWLDTFPRISSFVILDDDTFWDWGFLNHNVITTMTELTPEEINNKKRYSSQTTKDGLTRDLADKAAEILLRTNDWCISSRKD